jgi:hypothetical protein
MLKVFTSESDCQLPKSRSLEFVPFVQERDAMNRLLGSQCPPTRKTPACCTPLLESRVAEDQGKEGSPPGQRIRQAVSSFFRKMDLESRELGRFKTHSQRRMFHCPGGDSTRHNFGSAPLAHISTGLAQPGLQGRPVTPPRGAPTSKPPSLGLAHQLRSASTRPKSML